MPLSRHLCREIVVQALFACESRDMPLPTELDATLTSVIAEFYPETGEETAFCRHLVRGIAASVPALQEAISKQAPEWPIGKINAMDRAILYVGAYEMLSEKDTPPAVIINECVELAKKYGADNGPKFVNGVLNGLKNANRVPVTA